MTADSIDEALKTRAGMLLYRHLPEEQRYRDNPENGEPGDLEAYLHGFGDLLDLYAATLRQAHADSFAEPDETGTAAQGWILPYLAALTGAQLTAPDLDGTASLRREELNRSVAWARGKGTLRTGDDIADVLANAETVTVEGWQRMLACPRIALPPFTQRMDPPLRGGGAGAGFPSGTPDLRRNSRAAEATDGARDPLQRFRPANRSADPVWWEVISPEGVPCHPGSYGDRSARTPDLRSRPGLTPLGPAPRRISLHVQPPEGFFPSEGLRHPAPAGLFDQLLSGHDPASGVVPEFGPDEIAAVLGIAHPQSRLILTGDALNGQPLRLGAGLHLRLRDVSLTCAVTIGQNAVLDLLRSAVARVNVPAAPASGAPALRAKDCLIGEIFGPDAAALLEYVTVMGELHLLRLQASDCLFAGVFTDAGCHGAGSCLRYSRIPPDLAGSCDWIRAPHNTTLAPRFIRRPFDDPTGCTLRAARFGEPGAGVLDLATPAAVLAAAEDGTEPGAYHHLGHIARLAALARKMLDQLPAGQSLTLFHDPMLAVAPPKRV